MRTLNLGVLAHVDAGKTSLTERLLYAAGVIDQIGRVDEGSTQTDSLALERQRGITIKSAVVSFTIDETTINLIDTPGHPDFIAEVERVLGVLDGAVLVISAVEGVQAQTRVLLRTLRRLRIPTLLFVNKIDRGGARDAPLLRSIADTLTPAVIAMGAVHALGTRNAGFTPFGPGDETFRAWLTERLADHDETLLVAYVNDPTAVSYRRLRATLAAQTKRTLVHPVFFGSAITGAGVEELIAAITELLPATEGAATEPVSATVFKVERGPAGEKIAYVRLFSGTVRTRDRLRFGGGTEAKVTAIGVFDHGSAVLRDTVAAGQIGKLWGLGDVQIGDAIGIPHRTAANRAFAAPTLETVVIPCRPVERGALWVALAQLAEQDPLINLRQDDTRQEFSLLLYGEVQKEVIQATLANDYGIDVTFRETTTICVERPIASGAAVEVLGKPPNPFLATVGLRIEPAPVGSGVTFGRAIEIHGTMPAAFFAAVEESVHDTLRQGLHGWQVTDCTVTMTHSGYAPPVSVASDFRHLTPLVVMAALQQAGTRVCEPVHRFHLEAPADTLGALLPLLGRLGAVPDPPVLQGSSCLLEGDIPVARVHELRQQLPGLTRGEGALDSVFDHDAPVRGAAPTRPRSDHNPLDRTEYLLRVTRQVSTKEHTVHGL